MVKDYEGANIRNMFVSAGDELLEIYADAELHAPMLAEGHPYVVRYEIKAAKLKDVFTVLVPSVYVVRVIIFVDDSGKRLWMEDHYVKEEERFHRNKVNKDSLFYKEENV